MPWGYLSRLKPINREFYSLPASNIIGSASSEIQRTWLDGTDNHRHNPDAQYRVVESRIHYNSFSEFPPFDPDAGKVIEAPIERQTELVLEQVKVRLETAGSSLGNVLKCNVYCTSVEKFTAVNAIYVRYCPADPPARIFVCVPVVNARGFRLLGEPVRQISGSSASDSVQRFIGA